MHTTMRRLNSFMMLQYMESSVASHFGCSKKSENA